MEGIHLERGGLRGRVGEASLEDWKVSSGFSLLKYLLFLMPHR